YIWRERKNYDQVFVHMNPEYVVLGGMFWRRQKKKIGLWYTHRAVDLKLRLAARLADIIFTASKESFRLTSKKVKVVGHGINIDRFKPASPEPRVKGDKIFRIIYVGRVSRIKNQKLLIEALDVLTNKWNLKNIRLDLIGPVSNQQDENYKNDLGKMLQKMRLENYVNFLGSLPYRQMPGIYNQADLSVNLCPTGGVDKAVLEAMACGLPVIVFNKTFLDILSDYREKLILQVCDRNELAGKIKEIMGSDFKKREEIGGKLREIAGRNCSLGSLVKVLISNLHEINQRKN
ncbi:hypothetical protein COV56_01065, partial [Candidatus Kuenenbacteria bacterium CG11_big_fil_rev_8_21_14_0_20_37_9]